METLDDILSEEETPPSQARDEHGRFAAQETGEQETAIEPEPQDEVPPTSEDEPAHIPFAALKDERAKRQAIEAQQREMAERLQQYEAYFAQVNQPQQAEEDQDPLEIIAQQIMGRLQPQTEHQMFTMKVNMAEQFARQKWADYDEKVEHFKEAVQTNPFLLQELRNAENPAEYAYNAASNILAAKSYGGQAPSREQIEAELRQQIMAELNLPSAKAPTTLAGQQSRGTRAGPAWSGPTSMNDLLS